MDDEKSMWINKETDETVAEKGGTYLVLNNSVKKDFLQTVSHKNVALKNFAISTGNICAEVYFWQNWLLRVCRFTKN